MRLQLGILAVLFLLAHLFFLPPTLEDIDSINLALGVRDFDVAQHQPHPPGYPVFIAVAKLLAAVFALVGATQPIVLALGVISAVAGAALVVGLFLWCKALSGDSRIAWWAMAIGVCCPLFWFTALRPLSDMAGLAAAIAAQTLLALALGHVAAAGAENADWPGGGRPAGQRARMLLLAGAFIAGLGTGIRVQAFVLTGPLLVAALLWPRSGFSLRDRAMALAAAAAGVLVWTVPLVIVSGGADGYLAALSGQAGEDFATVEMLWTSPSPRVALNAFLNSFLWPWGSLQLGLVMMLLATAGLMALVWRAARVALLLVIAFAPYAAFHLLFQETPFVRYALPLVVPMAFLAMYGPSAIGPRAMAITALSVIVVSLAAAVPAARAYGSNGSPAFTLFGEMTSNLASSPEAGATDAVVGMHAVMRRVERWERANHDAHVLLAPHGREWLSLVGHWRAHPSTPVRFLADARRTDLVLFDPQARSLDRSERWPLPEMPFLAGARPGPADLYTMRPPGWMLGPGWALTAEVGGVTARDRLGPHVAPSVAWVRGRAEPAAMIIGGRNLGGAADPAARVTVSTKTGQIGVWDARPGFFLWQVPLPAGTISGSGYIPLEVSAAAGDGSGRPVRVSLEQFDLQSDGVVMFGYGDGWYEPEYNPATGRAWRWMSERARLWVRPVGRDVIVRIDGESPLRYFDRVPLVRVLAAGVELARFSPSADFTHEVTVPGRALELSGGLLTFESEFWFTPAERGESADQRHLALRIYSVMAR